TKFSSPCKLLKSLWTGSSMVEQLTLNQRVGGSSPPRFTKLLKHLQLDCGTAAKALVVGNVVGEHHFALVLTSRPALAARVLIRLRQGPCSAGKGRISLS